MSTSHFRIDKPSKAKQAKTDDSAKNGGDKKGRKKSVDKFETPEKKQSKAPESPKKQIKEEMDTDTAAEPIGYDCDFMYFLSFVF